MPACPWNSYELITEVTSRNTGASAYRTLRRFSSICRFQESEMAST